jgi:hypothetical protein
VAVLPEVYRHFRALVDEGEKLHGTLGLLSMHISPTRDDHRDYFVKPETIRDLPANERNQYCWNWTQYTFQSAADRFTGAISRGTEPFPASVSPSMISDLISMRFIHGDPFGKDSSGNVRAADALMRLVRGGFNTALELNWSLLDAATRFCPQGADGATQKAMQASALRIAQRLALGHNSNLARIDGTLFGKYDNRFLSIFKPLELSLFISDLQSSPPKFDFAPQTLERLAPEDPGHSFMGCPALYVVTDGRANLISATFDWLRRVHSRFVLPVERPDLATVAQD